MHKLLIEAGIKCVYTGETILTDIVKGDVYNVQLLVTNLGCSIFPGSDIKIEFCYPKFIDSGWNYHPVECRCPEIEICGQTEIYSNRFRSEREGILGIEVKMVANDGNIIEYYQLPNDKLKGDLWRTRFFITSREYNQIAAKLDEIISILE